ncbi:MAG TPA: histidine kinase dimerization/phospho-acceptor domain-containing protein [Candidatus Angelobacter sp.]|nr:histidine kinase dimerization/phospho-acceptor domain-containing protein [Candidatus Angelobacter sp.]
MLSTTNELIREMKHQINSPLAAIRNALYLTGVRISDPEAERYLKLADAEVSRIAAALNTIEQLNENKGLYLCWSKADSASPAA